jgi:uncharacterized protein
MRTNGWRMLIVVIVAVLAVALAISWAIGSATVRSGSSIVAKATAPARDLTIISTDGLQLAATFRPGIKPDAPAVLLLHGSGTSREQTTGTAAWLASKGYAALTIDFRGHGQSARAQRSFGLFEAKDARAAFDWLKRQEHGAPVAVIGISLGGASALLGEDGPLPADALVLQGVYPDIRHAIRNRIASLTTVGPALVLEPLLSFQIRLRFGVWPSRLSPLAAIREYRGPVLIIGGGGDRYTPPAETRQLYAAARGPKTVWLAPDADHGDVSDLQSSGYRQHLVDFLGRTIGAP